MAKATKFRISGSRDQASFPPRERRIRRLRYLRCRGAVPSVWRRSGQRGRISRKPDPRILARVAPAQAPALLSLQRRESKSDLEGTSSSGAKLTSTKRRWLLSRHVSVVRIWKLEAALDY